VHGSKNTIHNQIKFETLLDVSTPATIIEEEEGEVEEEEGESEEKEGEGEGEIEVIEIEIEEIQPTMQEIKDYRAYPGTPCVSAINEQGKEDIQRKKTRNIETKEK